MPNVVMEIMKSLFRQKPFQDLLIQLLCPLTSLLFRALLLNIGVRDYGARVGISSTKRLFLTGCQAFIVSWMGARSRVCLGAWILGDLFGDGTLLMVIGLFRSGRHVVISCKL